MPRRASCAALLAGIVLAAGAPAPAAAASGSKRLCADKTAVFDSPGGFGDRAPVPPAEAPRAGHGAPSPLLLVRFDSGPRGWILTSKICP